MGRSRPIALLEFDADRTPPREQNAVGLGVGHDREIGPAPRRAQIADRGRASAPAARRELEIAGALLARPVEIVVAWKARLLRSRDESLAQRMRLATHVKRQDHPHPPHDTPPP